MNEEKYSSVPVPPSFNVHIHAGVAHIPTQLEASQGCPQTIELTDTLYTQLWLVHWDGYYFIAWPIIAYFVDLISTLLQVPIVPSRIGIAATGIAFCEYCQVFWHWHSSQYCIF